MSCSVSDISTDNPFFPLRNDIFPYTTCDEIFLKPQFLEQHQAIKHVVSELVDGDSGKNIVRIIFKTGWTKIEKSSIIHRILKIHNSPKILSRFKEYRESVKAKAANLILIGEVSMVGYDRRDSEKRSTGKVRSEKTQTQRFRVIFLFIYLIFFFRVRFGFLNKT